MINGQVYCPVCGAVFADRPSLLAHSAVHTLEAAPGASVLKPNACKSCGHVFNSKSELTVHIVKYQVC